MVGRNMTFTKCNDRVFGRHYYAFNADEVGIWIKATDYKEFFIREYYVFVYIQNATFSLHKYCKWKNKIYLW